MALAQRRPLRVLVLICTAAVLTGITAAVGADRIAAEPASATLGWCTHYSLPYGQYSSTSAWESQFCYDHYWHYGAFHNTTGVAIRDRNVISFNSGGETWHIYYRNSDGSFNCCYVWGINSSYGASGGSNGYAEAFCKPNSDPEGFSMYCTTWW